MLLHVYVTHSSLLFYVQKHSSDVAVPMCACRRHDSVRPCINVLHVASQARGRPLSASRVLRVSLHLSIYKQSGL